MSAWDNFKTLSKSILGQTLLLIFGIIVLLFSIYLLTWARSGNTYRSLQSHHPQFHLDTIQGDTSRAIVFVDEFREGKTQINPKLAATPSIDRLIHQLSLVRMRAFHHQNYYIFFYRMRYGLSIIQAFASMFALVLGLIITREGWSNAKRLHLVTFFVFSSFAALLQLIPESLRMDENIQTNTEQYERHQTLEGEILTYLSTGLTMDEDEMEVPAFIVYTEKRIKRIQKVSLSLTNFPAEKISEKMTELEEQMQDRKRKESNTP